MNHVGPNGTNGAAHTPSGDDAVRVAAQLVSTAGDQSRVLLFTGTAATDGISEAAAAVASTLALMDVGEVLLVDANNRAPVQHRTFDTAQTPGLAEVLEHTVTLDDAVHPTRVPHLSLLTLGRTGADYVRLFSSERWSAFVQGLRPRFRHVIVDGAPVRTCPEAALLAARVDGTVAVARAGRARRSDLVDVKAALEGVKARLLGVVLTSSEAPTSTTRANGPAAPAGDR